VLVHLCDPPEYFFRMGFPVCGDIPEGR
jgi:hypothetical protein